MPVCVCHEICQVSRPTLCHKSSIHTGQHFTPVPQKLHYRHFSVSCFMYESQIDHPSPWSHCLFVCASVNCDQHEQQTQKPKQVLLQIQLSRKSQKVHSAHTPQIQQSKFTLKFSAARAVEKSSLWCEHRLSQWSLPTLFRSKKKQSTTFSYNFSDIYV